MLAAIRAALVAPARHGSARLLQAAALEAHLLASRVAGALSGPRDGAAAPPLALATAGAASSSSNSSLGGLLSSMMEEAARRRRADDPFASPRLGPAAQEEDDAAMVDDDVQEFGEEQAPGLGPIWFAVPKRKPSYSRKRMRQMNPAHNTQNIEHHYPCPKCDHGYLKLAHHLCPCDQEKINARAVVKVKADGSGATPAPAGEPDATK